MIISVSILLLILAIFILKPWKKQTIDPEVKIYNKFCNMFSSNGISREPHEGPIDFAKKAIIAYPDKAPSIDLITRLYIRLRFEAKHNERHFQALKNSVKNFKLIKK